MIPSFIEQFKQAQPVLETVFAAAHPADYKAILKEVVQQLDGLDPSRIHVIDDGDYQGTLIFVIAESGYQPYRYWTARVSYGSCSACDTLEGIRQYSDDPPTPTQVKHYMTLALHMVESLEEIGEH